MTLQDELLAEIEETRESFLQFLETIPESEYTRQSGNQTWTVGDVLYHLTLGPRAIAVEAWMLIHTPALFQFGLQSLPAKWFNRVNASFARRDARRFHRAGLAKAYQNAHTALRSVLKRARAQDFARSVVYPPDLVAELAGKVDLERLIRYETEHFELHAAQIKAEPRSI